MKGYIPFHARPFHVGPNHVGQIMSGHFMSVPFHVSPISCPSVPFHARPISCWSHFMSVCPNSCQRGPFHVCPISCWSHFMPVPFHVGPISCPHHDMHGLSHNPEFSQVLVVAFQGFQDKKSNQSWYLKFQNSRRKVECNHMVYCLIAEYCVKFSNQFFKWIIRTLIIKDSLFSHSFRRLQRSSVLRFS